MHSWKRWSPTPDVGKVIIISDRAYSEKATSRKGGVGAETQIISKEIYDRTGQDKFVVVVAEKDEDGNPFLPIYYRSRIYIDIRDDDCYVQNFEKLVLWICNKPVSE